MIQQQLLKRCWSWISFSKYVFLLFLLSLFFTNCQKDPVKPIETEGDFPKGVFITNEGAFNNGNASVSFYDPALDLVAENIFEKINGRPLGDVLQSMTVEENKAYLVINNSGKVEVVDIRNFTTLETIEGLTSPRYLQMIDNSTAYVSDLYQNNISVIDLNSNTEKNRIPFSSWSEEMVKVDQEVFVTRPSFFGKKTSNQLFVINTVSNEIVDSIQVGFNPVALELDKNNHLWVLCNGELNDREKLGGLYQINPKDKTVIKALPFENGEVSFAPRMAFNKALDELYFLKLDVFRINITADELPETPLIKAEGRDLYGLDIHPETDEIYLGDSGNFQQRGTVTIHDTNGQALKSFVAGVGVNGFYFN